MGRTIAFYFYEVSNGEDTLMFAPSDYVYPAQCRTRKFSGEMIRKLSVT
jgi:hypothetical protein